MYWASGVSSFRQLMDYRGTYKDECFGSFCSDSVKVVGNQYCSSQFTCYDRIRRVCRKVLYSLIDELIS
jgi:hypothetical protein